MAHVIDRAVVNPATWTGGPRDRGSTIRIRLQPHDGGVVDPRYREFDPRSSPAPSIRSGTVCWLDAHVGGVPGLSAVLQEPEAIADLGDRSAVMSASRIFRSAMHWPTSRAVDDS
jgi:hypothetical protein